MKFKNWNELVDKEREIRHSTDPNTLCSFGVGVLDDAMQKIFKDDLIIIGADSGVGKSSIALHIAQHNAKNGKIVALFFLEGGHTEAIRRIKWHMICEEYYKGEYYHDIEMDPVLWRMNHESMKELRVIEEKVEEKSKLLFDNNFFIYDVSPDLYSGDSRVGYDQIYRGLTDFFDGEEFGKIKFNVDLLVIDHLHYFEFEDSGRSTEAEKLTGAMRKCKEISDIYHVPTIVISHLRKKAKDRGLPSQDDFFGSSNIPKISTDSFTISPATELYDHNQLVYPTFFRFTKSRRGLKDSYASLVDYDFKQDSYSQSYEIYQIDKATDKPLRTPMEVHRLPVWARRGK